MAFVHPRSLPITPAGASGRTADGNAKAGASVIRRPRRGVGRRTVQKEFREIDKLKRGPCMDTAYTRRLATTLALSALALLTLPCNPSRADFDSGRAAYLRGDFGDAYDMFLPSALEGNAKSGIGLGLLLARGNGTDVDIVRSYSWFNMATLRSQGEHPIVRILAQTNRDYLLKQMTAEQAARARLLSAMMLATPARPAAAIPAATLKADPAKPVVKLAGFSPAAGKLSKALAAAPVVAEPAAAPPALYQVQLAARRDGSSKELLSDWSRLSRTHRVLKGLKPQVVRLDLGDFGVYQGLRAGPFDTSRDAHVACNALIKADQDCFVVMK